MSEFFSFVGKFISFVLVVGGSIIGILNLGDYYFVQSLRNRIIMALWSIFFLLLVGFVSFGVYLYNTPEPTKTFNCITEYRTYGNGYQEFPRNKVVCDSRGVCKVINAN